LLSVGFAFSQFDVGFNVAGQRSQLFVGGNLAFYAFAFAKNGLRFFGIAPKAGIRGTLFEGLQASAVLFTVKDNSARARCAASSRHIDAADLQESWSIVGPVLLLRMRLTLPFSV
jgi:hypothetical protein